MAASKIDNRKKVIEILNKARSSELLAISQYMDAHFVLDDLDYGKLATEMKKIAIDEMKHAEELAERIKDLGGVPTHERGQVEKDLPLDKIYPFSEELEEHTIAMYNDFINQCRALGDNVSAEILKKLVLEEDEHWTYFGDQKDHLRELGKAYLAEIAAG